MQKSKLEMSRQCNEVQLVWTKVVPLNDSGFAYWLSGQLYDDLKRNVLNMVTTMFEKA